MLIIGVIFSLPVVKKAHEKAAAKFGEENILLKTVETVLLALLLILSTAYLVDSTYNPFIYWNF